MRVHVSPIVRNYLCIFYLSHCVAGLSVCLFVYFSMHRHTCLTCLSFYLSADLYGPSYLSFYLLPTYISLSLYSFVYLSVRLSICLSVCLSFYVSLYLSICLSIFLCVCLSVSGAKRCGHGWCESAAIGSTTACC